MSNYENTLAAEWDRHDFSDYDDSYLDWCEENDETPEYWHYDEWLRERAADRDYDSYRDSR